MGAQEFNTIDVVRLEVETDQTGLTNMVQNPNGELGGWGWVTPVANTAMSGDGTRLEFKTTVSQACYFATEFLEIAAGQYAALSFASVGSTASHTVRVQFEWYSAAQVLLSSSVQSGHIAGGAGTQSYGPVVAPASTAYMKVRFDFYGALAGNPSAAAYYRLNQVTAAKAATSGALGTVRANLFANPSFETDASGWRTSGPSSSIVRSTAQAAVGTASLLFTIGTYAGDNAVRTIEGSGGMAVAASTAYAIQLRSRAATTARTLTWTMRWYDSAGTFLSTVNGTLGANVVGAWTTYNFTALSPSGAAYAQLSVVVESTAAAGEQHYFDAFHMEVGTSIASYFDGATTDAGGITYDFTTRTPQVKARTNLIANPSFETNTTGWEGVNGAIARVTAPAGAIGSACLQVTYSSGGTCGAQRSAGSFAAVVAGSRYQASAYVRSATSSVSAWLVIRWYNGAAVISETASTFPQKSSTSGWRRIEHLGVAPASATHAQVYVYFTASTVGEQHYIDAVLLEQSDWQRAYFDGSAGATPDVWTGVASRAWTGTAHLSTSTQTDTNTVPYSTATSTNLSYIEPVQYFNVIPDSHEIRVRRDGLNVGELSATILSTALDPSQSTLIRPGRRARLTTLISGSWEVVCGGKLLEADVAYDLKDPKVPAAKRARIDVLILDPIQALANAKRSEGVATIDELPFVLEGAGVPWNVNGSGNQVLAADVTTYNDGAFALNQVALTRDTALGYAWMSRLGVLNVWDHALIPAGTLVLDETDYSEFKPSFSTKHCINEVSVVVQSLGVDGTTTETTYGPYQDTASSDEWGTFQKTFTVTGLDTAAVDALAAAVLAANSTPRVRVNSLTLPLTTLARVAEKSLIDLFDQVNVVNTAKGIDDILRVTGIEHVIDTTAWMVTLTFADEGSVAMPVSQPPVQSGARPDVGVIELFAGPTANIPPTKKLCDGASLAVADWPYLFAVIGYEFGGAGAFFNVPNLTDRFPIGSGTKALGTTGGAASRVLVAANLPPHAHTINHGHTGFKISGTAIRWIASQFATGTAKNGYQPGAGTDPVIDDHAGSSGNGPGTSTAVDILNPWLSVNYVIRAV